MPKGKKLGIFFLENYILFPKDETAFMEASEKIYLEKVTEKENFWKYGGLSGEVELFWEDLSSDEKEEYFDQEWVPMHLRELALSCPQEVFSLVSKIFHFRHWQKQNNFCGACGTPLSFSLKEKGALHCSSCDITTYPRISPAIITRIEKEDTILLAKNAHFRRNSYSLIAGFVEPGESLEETVQREVWEEVGLSIKDIQYCKSQPWAFPDVLMVGFSAQWAGGEITVDNEEIVHADWFSRQKLPNLPLSGSIAHRMIREWVEKNQPKR